MIERLALPPTRILPQNYELRLERQTMRWPTMRLRKHRSDWQDNYRSRNTRQRPTSGQGPGVSQNQQKRNLRQATKLWRLRMLREVEKEQLHVSHEREIDV